MRESERKKTRRLHLTSLPLTLSLSLCLASHVSIKLPVFSSAFRLIYILECFFSFPTNLCPCYTCLSYYLFADSISPTSVLQSITLSSEMGGALCKCWPWWQYSDGDGPEPCSPSSSQSRDDVEFNPQAAAETHESPSSHTPTNYDVFLSFSGQDTRLTFTSHLYNALDQAGIKTFMDEKKLKQGEEIAPNLLKAIAESRISIPIFSTNYASSKWCLNELVKIMESRDTMRQTVLPIFYHVNPRNVRKQTDGFGQQFDNLAKNSDPEKVESWKEALKQAGKLKGWDLKTIDNRIESKLIKTVVEKVHYILGETFFDVENLVGIDSCVNNLTNLLNLECNDVKIVGIWGMGGIGKTTIAEAVFNKICSSFEYKCFLGDIRETSKQINGLVCLQKQLLCGILKHEIKLISNVDHGKVRIKELLNAKKVLIVLDDVDSNGQLEALVGQLEWFGKKSRIIITTRDKHLLRKYEEIYEAKELDFYLSLHLFHKHAFGKDQPEDGFLKLSWDLVHITGGLPLALKVLGSLLFGERNLEIWESTLDKLKKIPNKDIQEKLQISYEGLDRLDKKIFLDIACFFIGTDKEIATYFWEGCGFVPKLGIQKLIQRSLVTIDNDNKLRMHDQLRDMGRDIVCQESLSRPWECSRLWSCEEVVYVLRSKKGTEKVEGIILKFGEEETELDANLFYTEDFKLMSELRLLQIDNVRLLGDIKNLPPELRWLSWKGCLLESIPKDFCLEKLVVLDMSHSRIQVWNDLDQKKEFRKLKVLILSGCEHISKIPDLSRFTNLEKLNLEGCTELRELPPGICKCKSLKKLILSGCSKLCKLPDLLGSLEELEVLKLQGCELICRLPDTVGNMRNLKTLTLDRTGITEVPDAVGLLEKIEILSAKCCSNLVRLPDSVGKMRKIRGFFIDGTGIVKLPEDFGMLSSVTELNFQGCVQLRELPRSICNLKSLKVLILSDCSNLKEVPNFLESLKELKVLKFDGCKSLLCRAPDWIGNMRNSVILSLDGTSITELPNAVGSLEKMVELSVSHCSNLVKLPDSMGKMRHLVRFCMDGTGIVKLPEDFGMLSSLEVLLMSKCREFICFPESFGSLVRLGVLDVQGNSKLAVLPNSFSGLSCLARLHASGCNFSEGGIPSDFGKLPHLRQLGLSYNNFTSLPASISTLPRLAGLNLANCRKLQYMPVMPSGLKWLNVENCVSLESLPGLESLNLVDLTNHKMLSRIRVEHSLHLRMTGCSSDLLKSVKMSIGQLIPEEWTFAGNEIPDGFVPMKVSYGPRAIGDNVFRLDWEGEEAATSSIEHEKFYGVVLCFVFTFLKDSPPDAQFEIAGPNYLNGGPFYTISRSVCFSTKRHQYQTCLLFWRDIYYFEEVVLEACLKISFMIRPLPVSVDGGCRDTEFEELGQKVMEVIKAGMRLVYVDRERDREHPNLGKRNIVHLWDHDTLAMTMLMGE